MTVFSYDRGRWTHDARTMRMFAVSVLAVVLAVALTGCGGTGTSGASDGESEETTPQVNYGMAGAPLDVVVSLAAIESTPTAPVLDTPESAVRSYLDWISYGYRTAQPAFSKPTMSEAEAVRIDAYNEYNLQKGRIIDQTLDLVTFGEASVEASAATISTTEQWTYRYVSLTEPGKTVDGPFKAEYESTYSLIQTDAGWVVDSVSAERAGDSE